MPPLTNVIVQIVAGRQANFTPPKTQTGQARPPRELPVPAIEAELGHTLLKYTLSGASVKRSAWVDGETEYYAQLGPGAVIQYARATDALEFSVMQQAVISSSHASYYVFPAEVGLSVVDIKGFRAVCCVPPANLPFMPFLEWFPPGRRVRVYAGKPATEPVLLSIANGLA